MFERRSARPSYRLRWPAHSAGSLLQTPHDEAGETSAVGAEKSPHKIHGQVAEWLMAADCKSAARRAT